ncbi:hypothetical protein LVJ85_12405 [Neisseria sp. Dent CA1/247]|nr:hypothetical protein [Neisseria sp. Dent CA1/247]UOO76784.1 hypothetical protein LVJ85_12405 [Neisseria sp. Dent CA1/247]
MKSHFRVSQAWDAKHIRPSEILRPTLSRQRFQTAYIHFIRYNSPL